MRQYVTTLANQWLMSCLIGQGAYVSVPKNYVPGLWTTIALQAIYCIGVLCMSMHLRRQNQRADAGTVEDLEGVEGFRYAP